MDLGTEPSPHDDDRRHGRSDDDPDGHDGGGDRRHDALMWSRDVVVDAWLEGRF